MISLGIESAIPHRAGDLEYRQLSNAPIRSLVNAFGNCLWIDSL